MDTNPDRGYNRYDPTDKPRNEGTAIAPDGDDRRIALEGYPEIRLHLQMIRLTEEDLRLISLMQPFIADNQDQLADSFYECILQTDNLREIFSKHVDMGHLRAALCDHIVAMFAGRIDESYIERRFRIAVFHQKVGVPPKWYITLYQNLLTILLSFVHEISDRLSDVERMRQAITKLISFEQQLGLEAYEQRSQNEERKAKAVIGAAR
ncbi:protoglobin domain-containing protein [Brevibacillus sp. TJ4]|uniref:protoglobin domain-containing protein n=1 Tax=Brevibacillus sp. TJ4 TaxID=3234853 RepID=UPI003B9EEBA6